MDPKKILFGCSLLICWAGSPAPCPAELTQSQRQEVALRYYRGVVNFEAGNYENAFAEFEAVAKVDPYYNDTQKYLKDCVDALERYRGRLFEEAGESSKGKKGDTDFYFLGKSYYEKGEYKKATDAFKAVLETNPNDKFALYYLQLCKRELAGAGETKKATPTPEQLYTETLVDLDKEVSYVKEDIRSQEETEQFLEAKVRRMAEREELIKKKEMQLARQEEILKDEKKDYLAQEKISKKAKRLQKDIEKWKGMRERLEAQEPGTPAAVSEAPVCMNQAQTYYARMKDHLRASRWNSAGLNAIEASLRFCDAVLIYFYSVKSAYPTHANINSLLLEHVQRSDIQEVVFMMRSILNMKKIAEDEQAPFSRSQAVFLADQAEKISQWARSVLPL